LGPKAGLDDVEKRKFSTLPGLELRPLGRPARKEEVLSRNVSGGTGKDHENILRVAGLMDPGLYRGLPEYEAGMPAPRP
jgi:hypothetical protein